MLNFLLQFSLINIKIIVPLVFKIFCSIYNSFNKILTHTNNVQKIWVFKIVTVERLKYKFLVNFF